MGEAKRRGSFEQRKAEAIKAGQVKHTYGVRDYETQQAKKATDFHLPSLLALVNRAMR